MCQSAITRLIRSYPLATPTGFIIASLFCVIVKLGRLGGRREEKTPSCYNLLGMLFFSENGRWHDP